MTSSAHLALDPVYAWCLSCGQSFEAAELDARWRCVYCDAPAQRLIASATPIQPAVINGRPVVYSVLVRCADKPKYVSLAMPQHVRREPRIAAKEPTRVSPRPRRREASSRPRGAHATLIDLRAGECRYALTDEPPHMFCGAEAMTGCSWCEEHAGIVYVPLAVRRLSDRLAMEQEG